MPHTKVFTEERERPVLVAIDQRNSMNFGSRIRLKSVQAAELGALLVWSAYLQNDRVGGFVWNDRNEQLIKPMSSQSSMMQLLNHIARLNRSSLDERPSAAAVSAKNIAPDRRNIQVNDGASLLQILKQLRVVAKPGTHINIISDYSDFDQSCYQQLFQLRKHCDITLFRIFDQLEHRLPTSGSFNFSTETGIVKIDAGNKATRDSYSNAYRLHEAELASACNKLGASLMSVDCASDLTAIAPQLLLH